MGTKTRALDLLSLFALYFSSHLYAMDSIPDSPVYGTHGEFGESKGFLPPGYQGVAELNQIFVEIPAGFLPGGIPVASFEASQYPVTQHLWNEVMGSLPKGLIEDCENCPVTYVKWENRDNTPAEVQTFLTRLNEQTSDSGCTYDLPSDQQLHYMIRGDVTGTNMDRYSAGVTDANVNEYVTHFDSSTPDGLRKRVRPVGGKALNHFGIELGNVWKFSKDLYDPSCPYSGRSLRGGSWIDDVSFASSCSRSRYEIYRSHSVGFYLVRTCN